jgi:hypothetical protein
VTLAIPAASAQTDTVTIASVTPSVFPALNPGQISIAVVSDSPLNELNVEVMSGSTMELSYTLADFTLAGTNMNGVYKLTSPITMSELPNYGTYTIDVTAGDTGGGSATNDTTPLFWLTQPTITPGTLQLTFDYQDQSVTFSGTLSLTNPDGSADTANLAGQSLLVSDGSQSQSTTTTTGGAYSTTLTPTSDDNYFTVSSAATATQAAATSSQIYVTAIEEAVAVTATASAAQLNYGQTLSITGTATYQASAGSTYVPLPNSTVQLYAGPYYDETGPFMTATTNAAGQYSFSFKDDGTAQWYVYAGGLPGDPQLDYLLSQASATMLVNVALPVKINGLRASLSPFAVLTLTGCLVPGGADLPLRAQYATKKSGPWITLRTVEGTTGTSCGSGSDLGETFQYQVPVKVSSAYYRLSYPGSSDWQPAVSAVVHESKDLTKITAFEITPRTVRKDHFVTISGRLWKYARGWHPLANQHVWIFALYKGKYYYYTYKPKTSLSGRFKHKFAIPFTAKYFAEYMGGKLFFASASVRLKVTVTSRASAAIGSPRSIMALPAFARPPRL